MMHESPKKFKGYPTEILISFPI